MANETMKETPRYAPLPVWARKREMQALTGAPDKFLYNFAAQNPNHVRKFGGGGSNGTLVFNVEAVLAAIESIGR